MSKNNMKIWEKLYDFMVFLEDFRLENLPGHIWRDYVKGEGDPIWIYNDIKTEIIDTMNYIHPELAEKMDKFERALYSLD